MKNDTISEVMDIPQLQGLYRSKVYLDLQQNTLYIPNNREKTVCIYNLKTKTTQKIENVVIECFIKHSQLGLLGIGKEGIFKIENDKAILYIPLSFEMQNKMAIKTRNGDMYIKDFFNIYRISGKKVEHLHHNSSIYPTVRTKRKSADRKISGELQGIPICFPSMKPEVSSIAFPIKVQFQEQTIMLAVFPD